MDEGTLARLDVLEKTVGDLVARYNAAIPFMQQMAKVPDLVCEWGEKQIKLGEQMNGYVNELSRILELLQGERGEAEKGKAGI